jgi:hypothetical protein
MDLQKVNIVHALEESGELTRFFFLDVVGSDFNEASLGELKRADDGVQLSVAHDQPRRVTVHTRHADSLLGMEDQVKYDEKAYYEQEAKDIQDKLMQATSTVFDAELFSNVKKNKKKKQEYNFY